MAAHIEDELDALNPRADVVLVARGGQDLHRFGLTYSHIAFARRAVDGRWEVLHELNLCKTDHSDLYQEGLSNFVGDSVLRADVLAVIPKSSLQENLRAFLSSTGEQAKALHDPRYSMLAYPFSTKFQNSNQWVLEVIAAAAMSAAPRLHDRKDVQSWLKEKDYRPSKLHIRLYERAAARFFIDNVAVADHPVSERVSGNYSVVTVDSVVDFLKSQDLIDHTFVVARDQNPNPPNEVIK